MKIFIIIFFLAYFCYGPLFGQDTITLFRLDKQSLSYSSYPWGDEISLDISGYAVPDLNKGVLAVEVFYEGMRLYWNNLPLLLKPNQDNISFELVCDPINRATQKILAGEYLLRIAFYLDNQETKLAEDIKKRLGSRNIQVFEKKFQFGNPEKRKESLDEIRNFYLQRIKAINDLFADLGTQQRNAMLVQRDLKFNKSNPFIKNNAFSKDLWSAWWLAFLQKLEEEKKILDKNNQKYLVQFYPTTHIHLLTYNEIIEQLSRTTTISIYEFYKINANSESQKVDNYRVEGFRDILRYIREMHIAMEKEMNINLKSKLGYFPPPLNK